MYKLLLILRYLRRKLALLFAAAAVTLCTAMVIIVISVMGGFLRMMNQAAQTLEGDVTIGSDLTGFPEYEAMLAGVRKLPQVAAATPVIKTYGLLELRDRVFTVEVVGVEPESLNQVIDFRKSLHWTTKDLLESLQRNTDMGKDEDLPPEVKKILDNRRKQFASWNLQEMGMALKPPPDWEGLSNLPGIVPGIEVSPDNQRDNKGQYSIDNSSIKSKVNLTVMRLSQKGQPVEPESRQMVVVNEFKSGLYDVDANRVFVPFKLLQEMVHMDPSKDVDPETGKETGRMTSGRASSILVKGKPDVPLEQLREAVREYARFFNTAHPGMPQPWVQTWQEKHATFLGAVEKEKMLLTILFAIISVVAVAMIGVIFYMIVLEKTRDIGVLRALGASRTGVMSIFLGYGLAIGVVGALLGLILAAAVVWNINDIQTWLDQTVRWVTQGRQGFIMWNPSIYYFDRIPSQLDPFEVSVIVCVAILSSVLGSLVPAYLAGRLNPVESLRYE